MVPIEYRGFRPGDEPHIIRLCNKVFAKPITPEVWRWAYADNPAALGRYELALAWATDKLVGLLAAVPLPFVHGEQPLDAVRFQDAVVHPDFQRRGIFTESVLQLGRLLEELRVDYTLGFPNENALPGWLKTGRYMHLFDIFPYELPIDRLAPEEGGRYRVTLGAPVFSDEDVELVAGYLRPCTVYNPRGRDYLNWRFAPASGKRYVLARLFEDDRQIGWAVAKSFPSGGSVDVVEAFVPSEPGAVMAGFHALARAFAGEGIRTLGLWSLPHYPLHATLESLGFACNPRATHVLYRAISDRCSSDCERVDSYYLSMGDSDVY